MKRTLRWLLVILILLNVVAAIHAFKFTHYSNDVSAKTDARQLTAADKIKILFTGVNNPKPLNQTKPSDAYKHIVLKGRGDIDCWFLDKDSSKGTVIIFHGFSGEKSGMVQKAEILHSMGYKVILADFVGSGASSGNQVTLGYKEAEDVKVCADYCKEQGEQNIYLLGTSMGAAAILRAVHEKYVSPKGIMIECPFGTMYDAVAIRFDMMHVPKFPMAHMLMFWGGLENGFWAYNHNPQDYAKAVICPALLMFGEKDDRVTRAEIDRVYQNLAGKKQLVLFPESGHESYLIAHKNDWTETVKQFLNTN